MSLAMKKDGVVPDKSLSHYNTPSSKRVFGNSLAPAGQGVARSDVSAERDNLKNQTSTVPTS